MKEDSHGGLHLSEQAGVEYDAYAFWVRQMGAPEEAARKMLSDPVRALRRHAGFFDAFQGNRVANICGSCGKTAVPLALLGASVSVFGISEDNRRYALEVAQAAGVSLDYQVGDVMEINLEQYGCCFDAVFMEGGVLHYFHDIGQFMVMMHSLLKQGGRLICSDCHPFTKIMDALELQQPAMSYFSADVFEGEMAHARFYPEEIRRQFPKCSYRKYMLSEMINAVIGAGFILERFEEHPAWERPELPGEFTILARK